MARVFLERSYLPKKGKRWGWWKRYFEPEDPPPEPEPIPEPTPEPEPEPLPTEEPGDDVLIISPSGPGSDGGIAAPTYTPDWTFSAAGGTPGDTVSGWASAASTNKYSTDITGPFGGSTVAEQELVLDQTFFLGTPINTLSLASDSDIWIRAYFWFPTDFCFSYSNLGDGFGATKWFRNQYSSGGSARATIELGDVSETSYDWEQMPTCVTETVMYGDVNELDSTNYGFADRETYTITRGVWIPLQVHWYLHNTVGWVRGWVGSDYLGQTSDHQTMSTTLSEVVFGNYWNGGAPKTQSFYHDEIIITSDEPNHTDSGGRSFIHPDTKVSDFP